MSHANPVALKYGRMSAVNFELLRTIEDHGPQTLPELVKRHKDSTRAMLTAGVIALRAQRFIAFDETTKEPTYILASKGRAKLASPYDVGERKRGVEPRIHGAFRIKPTAAPHVKRATDYHPTEFTPSTRPGAMVAFGLPSRWGDQLRWPDGRCTQMDGATPWRAGA